MYSEMFKGLNDVFLLYKDILVQRAYFKNEDGPPERVADGGRKAMKIGDRERRF